MKEKYFKGKLELMYDICTYASEGSQFFPQPVLDTYNLSSIVGIFLYIFLH